MRLRFVADLNSTPQQAVVNSRWQSEGDSINGEPGGPVECLSITSQPDVSLNVVPTLPVSETALKIVEETSGLVKLEDLVPQDGEDVRRQAS